MRLTDLIGVGKRREAHSLDHLFEAFGFEGYRLSRGRGSGGTHIISYTNFRLASKSDKLRVIGYVGELCDYGLSHDIFTFFLLGGDLQAFARFNDNVINTLLERLNTKSEVHIGIPSAFEQLEEAKQVFSSDMKWRAGPSYIDTRTSLDYILEQKAHSLNDFATGSMVLNPAEFNPAPFTVLRGSAYRHELSVLSRLGTLGDFAKALYEQNHTQPELDMSSEMALFAQKMANGEVEGIDPDKPMPGVVPSVKPSEFIPHKDLMTIAQQRAREARQPLPHIYHPEMLIQVGDGTTKHINIRDLAETTAPIPAETRKIVRKLDDRSRGTFDRVKPQSQLAFVFFNPDIKDFYDDFAAYTNEPNNAHTSLVVAQAFASQGYYPLISEPDRWFQPQKNFRQLPPDIHQQVLQILDIATIKGKTEGYKGIGIAIPMEFGHLSEVLVLPEPTLCLKHGITSVDVYLEGVFDDDQGGPWLGKNNMLISEWMNFNHADKSVMGDRPYLKSERLQSWLQSFKDSGVDCTIHGLGHPLYESQLSAEVEFTLGRIASTNPRTKVTYHRPEVKKPKPGVTHSSPGYYSLETHQRVPNQSRGERNTLYHLFFSNRARGPERMGCIVGYIREHCSDHNRNIPWFLQQWQNYLKAPKGKVNAK